MMKFAKHFLLLFVTTLLVTSCGNPDKGGDLSADFEVRDFKTLTNWNVFKPGDKTTKLLYLDYTGAIKGFSIPSVRQTEEGNFCFEFSIKNKSNSPQKFSYKLYYQNESYKFPECIPGSSKEHPYAQENFYGSWNDVKIKFVATPEIPADGKFHKVQCNLSIMGNPRNEKQFFDKSGNGRGSRNPRMGNYSFLLVVTKADSIQNKLIPEYICNISLKNHDRFVNPYYYFLYGEGTLLKNVFVQKTGADLCVIAQPDLRTGIYSNPNHFDPNTFRSFFTKTCNFQDNLFQNAPFSMFTNNVNSSSKWDNIPVIADVLQDNYSLRDYNWNRAFYKKEEMITTIAQNIDCPCQQNYVDTLTGNMVIRNQASHYGDWKKQSVGVIARHGFTYGKYTIKVKLTELLNKNGIWNGITNAIWLMTSGGGSRNYCRECTNEGYLPKYGAGKNERRSPVTDYSEIDFEIMKTVPYCPSYEFPPSYLYPVPDKGRSSLWNVPLPESLLQDTGNVMISCTNWDMACPQPRNYNVGCMPVNYGNQTFLAHRWDYWYRAITERTPASDDEMFASPYYYFQIEWKPTEIIWRIGPEKDQLRVVGYMDDAVTSIPNNQMILIISQEFHNTEWWPGSPFEQQFIPFPKNDLVGRIMEITVE
jgi:hypothetical protein